MPFHYGEFAMSKLPPDTAFEQWKRGVQLSFAGMKFGDARLIRLFREAQTKGTISANRIMLFLDVWEQLRNGELVAFGRRILPTVSDGPVVIPEHIFHDRPPFSAGETDDIVMSGWHFENVKVGLPAPETASEGEVKRPARRKPGPKSHDHLVSAAIDSLRASDSLFDGRGQEKRIQAIRIEMARLNPALYPGKALPGHTTVWNYVTGRKPLK